MSTSTPISGLTSVVITAAITNMNGFIVIGALQGSFDSTTQTLPTAANIKNGIFTSNTTLTQVKMIHTSQNYNTTFQFADLQPNTVYSFFYYCTVEDPQITSLGSTVSVVMAQTLQMLTIDINWERFMGAVVALLALSLLL